MEGWFSSGWFDGSLWERQILGSWLIPTESESLQVGARNLFFLYTGVCSVMSNSLQLGGIIAHRDPLSMEFSRQECWSGFPFPPSGDLPDPHGTHISCIYCATREAHFFSSPLVMLMCTEAWATLLSNTSRENYEPGTSWWGRWLVLSKRNTEDWTSVLQDSQATHPFNGAASMCCGVLIYSRHGGGSSQ